MSDLPRVPITLRSVEATILAALLEQEGDFVSGTALAKRLKLSRVAVWQHMEKMREEGFVFEAMRAKGYRLVSKPSRLHPDLIGAYLGPRRHAFRFTLFDTLDSTNDEAARQLAADQPAPLLVAAHAQTRGRGRFGRTWHSTDSGNLYLSFGFRPGVDHARMQTFTLWMGVSVCDLIATYTRTSPGLKWPNDILFDGRKAGGMLTEARIDVDQIRDLVFGLGLNLTPPPGGWQGELDQRAVSLSECLGTTLDANRFTAALIGRILDAYEQFLAGRHGDALAEGWQRHDALRGRTVTVIQGQQRHTGTAVGIDAEGALLLRTSDRRTERFRAGEVTLEKLPLAASR